MPSPNLETDLLEHIGGVENNDLNAVLQINSKHDDQTETFVPSNYYSIDDFNKIGKNTDHNFSVLSLNIESIKSKFNQLIGLAEILDRNSCKIDAYLIQETWLDELQCKSNVINNYHIPGYHTISLGHKCGRKGGIIIYLNENYTYSLRNLYTTSQHWEGLFIDITHKHNQQLPNKLHFQIFIAHQEIIIQMHL